MNEIGKMLYNLTINSIKGSSPRFEDFTETTDTLKDLWIATLDILSTASNQKYSKEENLRYSS